MSRFCTFKWHFLAQFGTFWHFFCTILVFWAFYAVLTNKKKKKFISYYYYCTHPLGDVTIVQLSKAHNIKIILPVKLFLSFFSLLAEFLKVTVTQFFSKFAHNLEICMHKLTIYACKPIFFIYLKKKNIIYSFFFMFHTS